MIRPTRLAPSLLALTLLSPAMGLAQDSDSGAFLYFTFCSTCHGGEGRGDGPSGQLLDPPPPDLTGLAARNDGTLPVARLIARIEGTEPLRAHGDPMPIYSSIFDGAPRATIDTDEGPVETSLIVLDLISWIETRQQ